KKPNLVVSRKRKRLPCAYPGFLLEIGSDRPQVDESGIAIAVACGILHFHQHQQFAIAHALYQFSAGDIHLEVGHHALEGRKPVSIGLHLESDVPPLTFPGKVVKIGSLKTLRHGWNGRGGWLCLLANCSARKAQQTDANRLQLANQRARNEARAEHGSPAVRSILPNSFRFVAKIRQLTLISQPGQNAQPWAGLVLHLQVRSPPFSDLPQMPSNSDNTAHVPEHSQAPARNRLRARIINLYSNFPIRYAAFAGRPRRRSPLSAS